MRLTIPSADGVSALLALTLTFLPLLSQSSWYWPFGSDGEEYGAEAASGKEADQPRLSELMEPAVTNIDAAASFAAEGKTSEAVRSYRAALAALDRVEAENPERAATAEFATLRNKRAYVNAAIDSILLEEARDNAKAVSVTDTEELEKKIADLRAKRRRESRAMAESAADTNAPPVKATVENAGGIERPKLKSQLDTYVKRERKRDQKVRNKAKKIKVENAMQAEIRHLLKADPKSRKARMMQAGEDLRRGDVASAKKTLAMLLVEKPGDGPALNLRAACEIAEGDLAAADRTLDQARLSNPRDYHAYYNTANLYLLKGNPDAARRFYETGRTYNGPRDETIEKAVKK